MPTRKGDQLAWRCARGEGERRAGLPEAPTRVVGVAGDAAAGAGTGGGAAEASAEKEDDSG